MTKPTVKVSDEDLQQAQNRLVTQSKEYLRECEEYAEQGYRPATCFHGTSLWTDYDNICGPCEDSMYDPRWHSLFGTEFNELAESDAYAIARNRKFDSMIEMIREDAKEINTKHDLIRIKTMINYTLDI